MRFLSFLLKLGLGGVVDKTLSYMEKKAELANDRERLKTQTTIEQIRAAVAETRIMADVHKSKMGFPAYWIFVGVFVLPLGFWWCAVIVDSVFLFEWNVAALPRPLDEWAGMIIGWVFFIGGGHSFLRGR